MNPLPEHIIVMYNFYEKLTSMSKEYRSIAHDRYFDSSFTLGELLTKINLYTSNLYAYISKFMPIPTEQQQSMILEQIEESASAESEESEESINSMYR